MADFLCIFSERHIAMEGGSDLGFQASRLPSGRALVRSGGTSHSLAPGQCFACAGEVLVFQGNAPHPLLIRPPRRLALPDIAPLVTENVTHFGCSAWGILRERLPEMTRHFVAALALIVLVMANLRLEDTAQAPSPLPRELSLEERIEFLLMARFLPSWKERP